MEVSIGPISMGELLERVQRMLASLVQKKEHQLEVRIDKEFPVVYADERKLQQILLNLLSNAIKFTPEKGKISVVVESLKGERGEETLQVSVSDSGLGIEKKDLETIFEAFQQADSSYTKVHQGTGLGLALVKKFVELQGGRIRVESAPGKGARFTFSIPSIKQ